MTDGSLPASEPRGSTVGLCARFDRHILRMSAFFRAQLPPKRLDSAHAFDADRKQLHSVRHGVGAAPPWNVPLG